MKHAKLWKRVLHEGVIGRKDLSDAIVTATIITDSRPGEQIAGGELTWSDKSGIVLPFPSFWYEYHEEWDDVVVGVLVDSTSQDEMRKYAINQLDAPDVTLLRCMVVYSSASIPPVMVSDFIAGLHKDGSLVVRTSDGSLPVRVLWRDHRAHDNLSIFTPFGNLIECLEMLSCKNVSLAPRDNDPKQARIATKRHGASANGYRYHVLVVRPAGSKPGTPGQEIGNMPRHVCRGHFAEYGPKYGKGKLFGKLEGRFYIPPHVKGKAENGIVEKDYEVRDSPIL